jgi:hypothetical protein
MDAETIDSIVNPTAEEAAHSSSRDIPPRRSPLWAFIATFKQAYHLRGSAYTASTASSRICSTNTEGINGIDVPKHFGTFCFYAAQRKPDRDPAKNARSTSQPPPRMRSPTSIIRTILLTDFRHAFRTCFPLLQMKTSFVPSVSFNNSHSSLDIKVELLILNRRSRATSQR